MVSRYVHIGESHRGYLGTGSVPWEPFWRGLAEMGYSGPLTFESFSSAVASKSLSQTLCVWRNLCAPPPLTVQDCCRCCCAPGPRQGCSNPAVVAWRAGCRAAPPPQACLVSEVSRAAALRWVDSENLATSARKFIDNGMFTANATYT